MGGMAPDEWSVSIVKCYRYIVLLARVAVFNTSDYANQLFSVYSPYCQLYL